MVGVGSQSRRAHIFEEVRQNVVWTVRFDFKFRRKRDAVPESWNGYPLYVVRGHKVSPFDGSFGFGNRAVLPRGSSVLRSSG